MSPSPPSALARLLSPVDEAAFFETWWEEQPLHVERGDAEHFAELLSARAIEGALTRGALRFPDAQMTRDGAPVPAPEYADDAGRLLAPRVARHHRDGATLVLSRADREVEALAALVRELQHHLGWPCQANAYLSPAGNRGFAAHHDTHDVFVLQVAGRKTFRFYSGGPELPFCDERYDPSMAGERTPGEFVELSAGDTLYIPRGIVHDARAHDDGPSLHITVGVFPVVLRDVLREAMQVMAERDPALRRSVPRPTGAAIDPGWLESLRRAGEPSSDALAEALSRLRDEAAIGNADDAIGSLTSAAVRSDIDDATILVLEPSVQLDRRGTRSKLRLPGRIVELDGALAAAVEPLVAAGRGEVGSLRGLDPQRRTALARRLLDEGVCGVG